MTRYSEHRAAATLLAGNTSAPLEVKQASLTLDDSWSPFVQGRLVVAIPDAAVLELADPRNDPRVSLTFEERVGEAGTLEDFTADWGAGTLGTLFAGGTLADITAAHFTGWNGPEDAGSEIRVNAGIRRRRVDHRAGELVLEFAGDEARLQDYALLSLVPETPGSTSVRTAVSFALSKIGAVLDASAVDATVDEAEALTWYPGTTGWDYVAGLVQSTNLRLWCDELGRWRLDPKDMLVIDRPLVLSEFTEAADDIDRDGGEWADGVVVEYEWTDATDVRRLKRDTAGDATSSRVLKVRHETPWPGRGAAQRILDRARRRGRVLELEAISRYSAYPAAELTALPPNTPAQTGIVERVTFDWPERTMQVRSRGLVDTDPAAWLLIPTGSSWLSEPAGGSWLNETIGVP